MNEEIKRINSVYFIGIGGIGMSAIARFFLANGKRVAGYDRYKSALVQELMEEGASVHFSDDVNLIPKDADLVVYTPAVPDNHCELEYYRENAYRVVKRSDVLQMITASSFNICVAGTHGKTTTTTMIAHILRSSGYGCNAFLGGISVNYDTNFWSDQRSVAVVEADEYDRSFLKLDPNEAVVTAMDPDHLDIYGTADAMEEAFISFTRRIRPGGLLVSKFGLKRGAELAADRHWTYSLEDERADVHARNIRMKNGIYEFDLVINNNNVSNITLNMGGEHNIENAVAAIAIASSLEIKTDAIREAVSSFKGVKRRFEYIVGPSGVTDITKKHIIFIDDYAHHPEELRALIEGAKHLFTDKKCTVIFQPHLYTRTRDLASGFARSLDLADEVWLLPIYPARELPIPEVSSEMIAGMMRQGKVKLCTKEELLIMVKHKAAELGNSEILITAGAGDIDAMVDPIKKILENR